MKQWLRDFCQWLRVAVDSPFCTWSNAWLLPVVVLNTFSIPMGLYFKIWIVYPLARGSIFNRWFTLICKKIMRFSKPLDLHFGLLWGPFSRSEPFVNFNRIRTQMECRVLRSRSIMVSEKFKFTCAKRWNSETIECVSHVSRLHV